jgi:hypothetical protein
MCALCEVGKSCDNSFPSAVIAKEITWAQRLNYSVGTSTNHGPDFLALAHRRGGGAVARQPPSTKHNLLIQIA